MALYQVPKRNPYQRTLRIFSGGAIFSLLGTLLFSLFEPQGLSDSVAHSIGRAVAAITLASVMGLTMLAVKEGTWKLKRKLRFEVSDGKITQSSADSPAIEIALNNIESLLEYRGWLLIRGAEPGRQISIPKEIDEFEALKRELTSYHPVTLAKADVFPFSFLLFVLMIIAWLFLLTSHARAVVLCAGIAVLGLPGAGTYSLLRTLRGKTKLRLFIVLTLVLTWVTIAWVVFQEVKAVL